MQRILIMEPGSRSPTTPQPKLVGDCNRCGLCCYVWGYACINLVVTGTPGQPMATRCGLHALRYDGMPIKLVDTKGRIVGKSKCALDSDDETENIIPHIGKGCSLRIVSAR